jgi:hypothetical protein
VLARKRPKALWVDEAPLSATPSNTPSRRRLLRLRFGMRTLLLAMFVAAAALAWRSNSVATQRRIALQIEQRKGDVFWSEPWGPAWLESVVGREFLIDVEVVGLAEAQFEDLEVIAQLPRLRELRLDRSQLTDQGMAEVAKLSSLEGLVLRGCRDFSVEDFRSLRRLPRLVKLNLDGGTALRNLVPLEHFAEFTSLKYLYISIEGPVEDRLEPLLNLPNLERLQVCFQEGHCSDLESFGDQVESRCPRLWSLVLYADKRRIAWEKTRPADPASERWSGRPQP